MKRDKIKMEDDLEYKEKIIKINRVNKVVKGGKRLAFRVLVIVGDQKGSAGYGIGKSREVPLSIQKALQVAKKSLITFNFSNGTIPHEVKGKYGSTRVLIFPAPSGTGVIAGGAVKILLEAIGLKDVVAKTYGSRNPINSVKATIQGLLQCKSLEEECKVRGKRLPVYISASADSQHENLSLDSQKTNKDESEKKADDTKPGKQEKVKDVSSVKG